MSATILGLPSLYEAADQAAADTLEGHHDDLLPEGGVPTERRWYTRLHRDDQLGVWLCSWVPGDPAKLHDHGGSLGALTVVSGALTEQYWDGTRLRCRRLDAGDQAGFPLGWVHEVVWAAPPRRRGRLAPTLSVHAYAPPLTAMSYYTITGSKLLVAGAGAA